MSFAIVEIISVNELFAIRVKVVRMILAEFVQVIFRDYAFFVNVQLYFGFETFSFQGESLGNAVCLKFAIQVVPGCANHTKGKSARVVFPQAYQPFEDGVILLFAFCHISVNMIFMSVDFVQRADFAFASLMDRSIERILSRFA